MATSLTLYYAISVLVLLAAAASYLYWRLERNLERSSRDSLIHKVQVLTHLVGEEPFNRAGVEQEVLEEAEVSESSQSPFLLRVMDAERRVVAETPTMPAVLPVEVFPSVAMGQISEHRWRSPAGMTFLLASSEVAPTAPGGTRWHIQVAVNVSASEALLGGYRRDIALVLLAGLLMATPMAAWIARRGLRPLVDIASATEGIGASQLHHRINTGEWPRELETLAIAFDRMLDRLQESFSRLKQFSADLAHELRTPINNLMGEAQVAVSRARTPAEYERVLQSALEEHGRLARMIDSMLFLAQADQARSLLATAVLDGARELQSVAEFYQALADEQGVTLQCEGDGTLSADAMLLRRAVSNLLSNALKHTARGGVVTLGIAAAGSDVVLRVADTGVGIAAEHLPRLGDRFYRVDPARADSSAGSGLGLALVKSIMQLHGGQMSIDSVPGSGTVVSLVFPAR